MVIIILYYLLFGEARAPHRAYIDRISDILSDFSFLSPFRTLLMLRLELRRDWREGDVSR